MISGASKEEATDGDAVGAFTRLARMRLFGATVGAAVPELATRAQAVAVHE